LFLAHHAARFGSVPKLAFGQNYTTICVQIILHKTKKKHFTSSFFLFYANMSAMEGIFSSFYLDELPCLFLPQTARHGIFIIILLNGLKKCQIKNMPIIRSEPAL